MERLCISLPTCRSSLPLGRAAHGSDASNGESACRSPRWLTGKARVGGRAIGVERKIRRSCIAALALLVIFGSQDRPRDHDHEHHTPTSGNVGTAVIHQWHWLQHDPGERHLVRLNGTVATVTSATTIKIIATVPSGASTGRITVTIGGSTATSSTDFTVKPQVLSFTPASGPVGTPITIHGEGFSPTLANNAATVHSTTATVSSATATQLVVAVPAGATTGTIKVTVGSFSSTSTASTTVTPSITGFSPASGDSQHAGNDQRHSPPSVRRERAS